MWGPFWSSSAISIALTGRLLHVESWNDLQKLEVAMPRGTTYPVGQALDVSGQMCKDQQVFLIGPRDPKKTTVATCPWRSAIAIVYPKAVDGFPSLGWRYPSPWKGHAPPCPTRLPTNQPIPIQHSKTSNCFTKSGHHVISC